MTLLYIYGNHWLRDASFSSKSALVVFYIFRETYVGLIASQQWSFMLDHFSLFRNRAIEQGKRRKERSISSNGAKEEEKSKECYSDSDKDKDKDKDKKEKAKWIVLIGGVCSSASVLGSYLLHKALYSESIQAYSNHLNLPLLPPLLLSVSGATISWIVNEYAFSLKTSLEKKEGSEILNQNTLKKDNKSNYGGFSNIWAQGWSLLTEYQLLRILFYEAILHQASGNMLNFMFHEGLRMYGGDEVTRKADLSGQFFAYVNIFACGLQIIVMPYLLTFDTLPVALVLIPLLTIVATSALYFQQSLFAVFLGFGVFKVLEYSVWYSCMELIWLEVPSQVRPLSKEIVRFLGHKTGKTVVSIGLSMVSSRFKPDLQQQALWCVCLLIGWLFTKYLLAQEVGHKKNKVKKE